MTSNTNSSDLFDLLRKTRDAFDALLESAKKGNEEARKDLHDAWDEIDYFREDWARRIRNIRT